MLTEESIIEKINNEFIDTIERNVIFCETEVNEIKRIIGSNKTADKMYDELFKVMGVSK